MYVQSAKKQTYIQRNHFYDIINKINMPKKIRDLIKDLEKAGFINRGGKGSHRNFVHPKLTKTITISGNAGDDAKHY